MVRRPWLAIAVVTAIFAIGGFASANVPETPTRIAGNARSSWDAIAIAGTRLAWVGFDLAGEDSEIFAADAAEPIGESISLCPLTNPCQLTDDDADDDAPLRSRNWIVWRRKNLPGTAYSLWFSDGIQTATVPGSIDPTTFYDREPLALSGSRLVWWGADGAGSDGIFLADLALPLAAGATSLCPLTNPCRIATPSATSDYKTGPKIDGTRVVWSAQTAAGEDTEIHVFDAASPADAAAPLACPLANPCLFTSNDRADLAPIVASSLIVWNQCENADCGFSPPTRMAFDDGTKAGEVIGDFIDPPQAISGTQIAWAPFISLVVLLDVALPIDLGPFGYPRNCPLSNPCFLDATGGVQMAGPWLLSSTATDVVAPIDLRLFDLRRPLDSRPFSSCPGTNPCVLRAGIGGGATALSTEGIAWLQESDLYFVPEPGRMAAAFSAVAVLAALSGGRSIRLSI